MKTHLSPSGACSAHDLPIAGPVRRPVVGAALAGLLLLLGVLFSDVPAASVSTPDAAVYTREVDPQGHRRRLLERMGVPAWHAAGYRGQGLKVAVLDSGFRGYRDHLGTALPARVKVRSFRLDHDLEARPSQHGILCAEVIHALAPEAEILLANWEAERPEQFLEAVRWARQEGCRIISCSVIMPTWSDCEGHGSIHEELARILGSGDRPGDVLCFASAGNTALRHWSGRFRDDGTGLHEWTGGNIDNPVTPWGKERVSVEMCWHSSARYELSVWDTTTEERVGRSAPRAGPGGRCAVVVFTPRSGRRYTVRVRLLTGSDRDEASGFHLVVLGGGLHTSRKQGSIPFPADGPEVIAVGAVNERGRRQAYSSCGAANGSKPDFVAPVPFPSLWRPRPFTGTSAAAPQAAAVAALVWNRHPDWNARQVRDQLRRAATGSNADGHPDGETGLGPIRLP